MSDNKPITFGSLFAGIGGMDLGLERAGMVCKWQVEIDDYATSVLEKNWPDVPKYRDICEFPPPEGVEQVDLICGGFPCQDISAAGKGAGLDGERSGLWSEYYRVLCELQPRYVVIENSPMLIVRGLDSVLRDLAKSGYDAEWQTIQASDFALPHRRKRIFIIAYANSFNGEKGLVAFEDRQGEIFVRDMQERLPIRVQTADKFVGVDDGVSGKPYINRGRGLGNAVVPQVAEFIGRCIMEAHQ